MKTLGDLAARLNALFEAERNVLESHARVSQCTTAWDLKISFEELRYFEAELNKLRAQPLGIET